MKRKKKLKFITLYDTFTETEKKHFKLFISSALFNAGRDYTDLLQDIESNNFKYFDLSEAKKNRTIWNRLSELTRLAENFLVLKSPEAINYAYDLLLLNELKKRNLNDYFEKHAKSLKSEIKELLPSAYYLSEFLELNKLHLNFLKSVSAPKKVESQFQETNDYRISLFILESLEQLIQLSEMNLSKTINSKMFLESFFSSLNFKEILLFIRRNVPDLYPQVAFHYHIYNALEEPLNRKHYETAKNIFNKKLRYAEEEARLKFYKYLMAYNIRLLNLGEPSNQEFFELIKQKFSDGLSDEILKLHLDIHMFRDYIFVALSLKEFEWTENFIERYGPILPAEQREDSIRLSRARLLFYKKEYSDIKKLLTKIKKSSPFLYVDSSSLKLKVCYELGEIEECYEELRRLKEYLRMERRVQQELVTLTKIFCNSYGLLLKLYQNPTRTNLNNLQFDLNKGFIAGRKWIKEKCEEFNY